MIIYLCLFYITSWHPQILYPFFLSFFLPKLLHFHGTFFNHGSCNGSGSSDDDAEHKPLQRCISDFFEFPQRDHRRIDMVRWPGRGMPGRRIRIGHSDGNFIPSEIRFFTGRKAAETYMWSPKFTVWLSWPAQPGTWL